MSLYRLSSCEAFPDRRATAVHGRGVHWRIVFELPRHHAASGRVYASHRSLWGRACSSSRSWNPVRGAVGRRFYGERHRQPLLLHAGPSPTRPCDHRYPWPGRIWSGNQDLVVGSWQGLPDTDDCRKANGCCGFVPPSNHRALPRRQHHIPISRRGSRPGMLDAGHPQRVHIGIHHVPGKGAAPLSRCGRPFRARVSMCLTLPYQVGHQSLPGATSSSRLPNGSCT